MNQCHKKGKYNRIDEVGVEENPLNTLYEIFKDKVDKEVLNEIFDQCQKNLDNAINMCIEMFGEETREAVKQFVEANNLNPENDSDEEEEEYDIELPKSQHRKVMEVSQIPKDEGKQDGKKEYGGISVP